MAVFGKGVNDAGYETQRFIKISDNKWKRVYVCPIYKTWKHMLERCYCQKLKNKYPTYEGCTVCNEWLTFSNFKVWMEKQNWKGRVLDKDLLYKDNKIYSAETCVFVDKPLNNFLTNTQRTKVSKLPVGVCWNNQHNKYQVRVSNPFLGVRESLGYYSSLEEASFTYRERKVELARDWAEIVEDIRLKEALANIKQDYFL